MELTPRLALAAELCRGCRSVIDVGCDHAYLCLTLAERGAERAYASDIRPGPLAAARAHIRACGMEDRVQAVLCPGLEAFGPEDADTIVICGMGGEMIASILEKAPWTREGRHRLVLQPMTCGDRLRKWLREAGYAIEQEALAREGRRLYTLLQTRGNGAGDSCGGENFYLFTQKLAEDPLFSSFVGQQREKYRKARAGKALAGLDTSLEDAVLRRLEEFCHGA